MKSQKSFMMSSLKPSFSTVDSIGRLLGVWMPTWTWRVPWEPRSCLHTFTGESYSSHNYDHYNHHDHHNQHGPDECLGNEVHACTYTKVEWKFFLYTLYTPPGAANAHHHNHPLLHDQWSLIINITITTNTGQLPPASINKRPSAIARLSPQTELNSTTGKLNQQTTPFFYWYL